MGHCTGTAGRVCSTTADAVTHLSRSFAFSSLAFLVARPSCAACPRRAWPPRSFASPPAAAARAIIFKTRNLSPRSLDSPSLRDFPALPAPVPPASTRH